MGKALGADKGGALLLKELRWCGGSWRVPVQLLVLCRAGMVVLRLSQGEGLPPESVVVVALG